MTYILINITILLVLCLVHLYWAMGGRLGLQVVVPSKEDGTLLFTPNPLACYALALALACFAYFHYALIHCMGTIKLLSMGILTLGGIVFLLRAVGMPPYIGYRKTISSTRFAHYDNILFSPICIGISLCSFICVGLQFCSN